MNRQSCVAKPAPAWLTAVSVFLLAGLARAQDIPGEATRRSLWDTIAAGGLVGWLLIFISLVAVYLIVEHFLTITRARLLPDQALQDLRELLAAGNTAGARQYCTDEQHRSLLTNVVGAGLERYSGEGMLAEIELKNAIQEAGEEQTARLYRRTEVLGLIGSISPMIGLLGTVLGMIKAFNTLAASGGFARPDELAGGIGQALVTTCEGLIIAIPALTAFSFFRNRIDSLVAEAGAQVEQLLAVMKR